MPEPLTLALGVSLAKLLLRWANQSESADALEDARAGFGVWRAIRAKKASDPASMAISNLLEQRLSRVRSPERREQMQIAVGNVAIVFDNLSDEDIRFAAQHPKLFQDHLARGPGNSLLAQTEEALTPFTRELMDAAATVVAELAPGSPQFIPGALMRLLDQVETAIDGITELQLILATARDDFAVSTSKLSDDVNALHPKVDRLLEASGRIATGDPVLASKFASASRRDLGRPIAQWDPVRLGVHPSIAANDEQSALTPYLERSHDQEMCDVLAGSARPGVGPQLVLALGTSCTGKTRTLYEATRRTLSSWRIVVPGTAGELAGILMEGVPRDTIIWLDEVQNRLTRTSDGIAAAHAMRQLIDAPEVGHILFAGTVWPSSFEAMQARPTPEESQEGAGVISELLQRATLVEVPEVFTPDDIAIYQNIRDSRLRKAISAAMNSTHLNGGRKVIQVLAGGAQLVERLYPLVNTPSSNQFSPAAKAVLIAAGDLRRIGIQNPIPTETIERAAPGYLAIPRAGPSEYWFPVALREVAKAAAQDDELTGIRTLDIITEGVPALTPHWQADLEGKPVEAWDLHDYIFQEHLSRRRSEPTRSTLWAAVSRGQHLPSTAWRLAQSAKDRGLLTSAISLYHACLDEQPEAVFPLAGLAEALAARGTAADLDELRERANAGQGYAQARLADYLRDKADHDSIAELWHRVKGGDEVAERRLSKFYWHNHTDVHLTYLRAQSELDGNFALKLLLRVLVRRGDDAAIEELKTHAKAGNERASSALVSALSKRGDAPATEELRILSDDGNPYATKWLVSQDRKRTSGNDSRRRPKFKPELVDADMLRARADAGVRDAKVALADFLVSLGGDAAFEELTKRAREGDVYARRRLPKVLAARGDETSLSDLRNLARAGNTSAQDQIVKLLVGRGDLASQEDLRSHVKAGYGGIALLKWLRSENTTRTVLELNCDAMPIFI